MGDPSGVNAKAAIRRPVETSDYDDVAAFGTNQIPILSESLTSVPEYDTEEANTGSPAQQQASIVGWNAGGVLSTEAWYESLEPLFLAAMGYECPTVYTGVHGTGSGGSPAPGSAGVAQFHIFELDDVIKRIGWQSGDRDVSSGGTSDPTYWTASDQKVRTLDLALFKGIPAAELHMFYGGAVKKATFKIAPGACTIDWELLCRRHDKQATTAKNYTSWAMPSARKRCLFPELKLYINAVGASESSSSENVADVEISLDNALTSDKEGGDNALYIQEPIREGTRKVTGRFKTARYRDDQYEQWKDGGTLLQARMVLQSGAVISGSAEKWEISWILPQIKITKAEFPVGGPGVISGDVEFEAYRPSSSQAWIQTLLGGITEKKDNELLVRMVNSNDACYSRDRQASGVTLP